MPGDLEKVIKQVYRNWKKQRSGVGVNHPDEEEFASFLEGKMPHGDEAAFKRHLLGCSGCAKSLRLSLAGLSLTEHIRPELMALAREKLGLKDLDVFEVFLRLKEDIFEVVKSTGDILRGQELLSASLLRSRNINEFKDEVVILKDFDNLRVQVKAQNKSKGYFDVHIQVKNRQSKELIRDLRITLLKGSLELESYLSDTGIATFEHIYLGSYRIEISDALGQMASVVLDVKK
jgi:hypothetical protein